ncbi:MAG: bifunctional (p)ppGpp synthetase/guanosine-3',5'-bis(diphosphate) 3'-pyrophosphohydrolase, partial [Oscillospiraceae bacterium]|nr:bifunctional (p)ppGpp synthetase/guanosine-3',5'-bis(diphosphate) 3'-pyrophosphohydrolase [Oscillospiraceae bacterium]
MTLFDQAIVFAVQAHSGMMRKRESVPYILHPMEVASIAGTITSEEEVLAAAVLHDTVEDTGTTIGEIAEKFGPRVASIVASETENKRHDLPPSETWHIRKEESLRELKAAEDVAVKIVWLSDKLANMRAFYRIWRISGNSFWKDFNQPDPAS